MINGRFKRGDSVNIFGPQKIKIAMGLVSYDDFEAQQIKGLKSNQIEGKLGYKRGAALVHAGDLVLIKDEITPDD